MERFTHFEFPCFKFAMINDSNFISLVTKIGEEEREKEVETQH